ncbi:MAG: hypothetical protein AAGK32_21680 [Actinomycetota bacterium]
MPNLIAGVWAIASPRSFFDDFPGWAPRLVAAIPPYNEHQTTDAGAGLFASGVAALLAAWWMRRDVVVTAMIAYLAFALPHALYHLANPADALTTGEDALNAFTLWVAVLAAGLVLLQAWNRSSAVEAGVDTSP